MGTGRGLQILPDSDRLEEALVRAAAEGSGFVDASGYLTFTQLIEKLGLGGLGPRRPCPPLSSRLVLWSCAQELGPGPFGHFAGEPAFAREALDVISELKGNGVTPAAFAEAVEQLPTPRLARSQYLARLYAAYEQRLASAQLADREDLLRTALTTLERGPLPSVLRGVGRIELRDLHDLSPARVSLLLALAHRCDREGIRFQLELPGAGATDVDMAVDPILGAFERAAQECRHVEAHKTDWVGEGRPLASVGQYLFSSRRPPENGAIGRTALEVLSVASARAEARTLARVVASRLEQGAAPEEVAVAFRELGEEAEAVAEELAGLGIPARLRRGVPLTATAAGRTALTLPLLVEEAYPAADLARVLTSRYSPRVSEGCPDGAGTLLAAAGVRDNRLGAEGEQGAYAVRLERFASRIEEREPKKAASARALAQCCERLISVCSRLPEETSLSEFLERWWRTVELLGLVEAVREPARRGEDATRLERAALQAMARDQAALESLQALVEEVREALRGSAAGNRKLSRRTFFRWLHDAAADFNLSGAGPRTGAVRILDVRELPGRSFAHLCLGGVVDGRFPGRSTPHPLFSDDDRRRINATVAKPVFRLSTGDLDGRAPWRLAEDRLLFYVALSCAREGATVTYARTSGGQEQLASPFIDELVRVCGIKVQAQAPFPIPPLHEVRTEEDLRARVAIEALARAELRISQPDPAGSLLEQRFRPEPWFSRSEEVGRIEGERLLAFGDHQRQAKPHTGQVGTDDLAEPLRELFRYGPEKPLSASSLNRFGNCAFQGFLHDVLRLEEPETPGEEIDKRGEGSFWHKVLEVLIPAVRKAGLLGRPVEEIPDAMLDQALETGTAHAEQHNHTGHPALWKLGRERARFMVARVLSHELHGVPFFGMDPAETELRFGRPESPPGWQTVILPAEEGEPPIHVEGTIDRLDRGPDGSVAVVDYKSSVTPNKVKERFLTQDFQLPLYLYAARAAGRPDAVQAAWLSMKDGSVGLLSKQCDDNVHELLSTDPEVQARVEEEGGKNLPAEVRRLVSGLRQGQFPAHPHDCEYCSYRAVCRVSERRMEEST
ncbi:MAG: PD-(D/E)XK nuclease family protein [Myxococcota bacterium]|nr:PD-(D/E)XK nuclease family protein [Myxococcota bacterium]